MYRILIIGAGQIGSRHLQALASVPLDINVYVIDPSEDSLALSKDRLNQVLNESSRIKSVRYYTGVDCIDEDMDLGIIATTSSGRAMAIFDLIRSVKVKNLILEKVLFQKLTEYDEVKSLIIKYNVNCWVNHPFRMYPFYKKLKEYFSPGDVFNYTVYGGEWGLGCNGLHYIDIFSYLTGCDNLLINTDLFESVVDAKRQGYKEFIGNLTGKLGDHTFSLYNGRAFSPLIAILQSSTVKVIIDEMNGWYLMALKDKDWIWKEHRENIMVYQSELTGVAVEEILNNGTSDLPSYAEAYKLHKIFISGLLDHLNTKNNVATLLCPIT